MGDLERLAGNLEELNKTAGLLAYQNILPLLQAWQKTMRQYPPQPSRTRAKTFNRYVRGVGLYPISFFKVGRLNAGKAIREGKGQVERTSEKLGSRWQIDSPRPAGPNYAAALFNDASYAHEVQGDQQKPYHKKTGWKTVKELMSESGPAIDKACEGLADDISRRILFQVGKDA